MHKKCCIMLVKKMGVFRHRVPILKIHIGSRTSMLISKQDSPTERSDKCLLAAPINHNSIPTVG